jgi:predicted AAA+ superfamily ATPase
MEEVLYRYNPWWEVDEDEDMDECFEGLLQREEHFQIIKQQLDNKQIVFLTGLRRIGKTSLMKLCVQYLIQEKNVEPKHIFYVSLDDYLLSGKSIHEILEAYRKIHRLSTSQKVYLFLDEITFVSDYDVQLKNLYDLGKMRIIASSSSASLLKEQSNLLTGRKITIEVLPLCFEEYLLFKNIKFKKADGYLREEYFKDYLRTGGIPEFVKTGDDAYIRELMDNIIYKDIAAIHGIKNIRQLKEYFLLLMERSGKTMSINKVAKILGISTETSKRYFDLFCDTFIVYPVTRYGKLNEQLVSPKKVYACDLGIRNYYTGVRDWGALFENYVFLRLKYLNLSYLYENTIELDFVTENKWLIECKFHEEELSAKQQKLFESFDAKQKFIIRSEKDIDFIREIKH